MEALVLWVVCAIAGGMIYQSKNRPFIKGFLWGLLLGVVGLIVTIAKPTLKENLLWQKKIYKKKLKGKYPNGWEEAQKERRSIIE